MGESPVALATTLEVVRVNETVAVIVDVTAEDLVGAIRDGEPLRVMACLAGAEHVARVKEALTRAVLAIEQAGKPESGGQVGNGAMEDVRSDE